MQPSSLKLILFAFLALPFASAADEYAIRNRMEILKPISLEAMNHDSQSATVVEDRSTTEIVDITYFPLRGKQTVDENPNWRSDNAKMAEFLKPGVTSNWDQPFREQLLKDLAAEGIFPDQLTDKQLVQKVSDWLVAKFSDNAPFITYYVKFKNGRPYVPDEFRAEVDMEKARFNLKTDEDAFERGLFGKGLYANRIHGSCTPSAILWTTVFRALGIPTRIVETAPPVDPTDSAQLRLLGELRDNVVRSTVISGVGIGVGAWANHTFVEVFVGKKWVRLNYNQLGQAIMDKFYFGMLTVVNRFNDWAESGLVDTWGHHVHVVQTGGSPAPLISVNPYRSLGLSEHLPAGTPNPPGELGHPVTVTIENIWSQDDPNLPAAVKAKSSPIPGLKLIYISIHEPLRTGDEGWCRLLLKAVSPTLTLWIPGGERHSFSLDSVGTFTGMTPSGLILALPESEYANLHGRYAVTVDSTNDPGFVLKAPLDLTLTIP